MSDALSARTIVIRGHGGDEVQAYFATPDEEGSRGGVVVIHHRPGYDRATKEMVRRFAELGYNTVCPNLYWREAPGASPDDAAAAARARGGVSDEQVVGDAGGALTHLKSLPTSNGLVGVIGYCSGGRHAALVACHLDFDAVIDCYGGYVTGTPPEDAPVKVTNIVDQLPDLRAPLLGLFGVEDKAPSPEHVGELIGILEKHNKSYEAHTYDDAGHAFFAVDRASYRVAAANDGWERVARFFATHLGA